MFLDYISQCIKIFSIFLIRRGHDEVSQLFQLAFFVHSSVVLTVLSESTVVFIRFHIFQLQLRCTVTYNTATAVFDSRIESVCLKKTHHGSAALWFVDQGCLVRRKYFALLQGEKLVTDWYLPKKVLKQLTVHSLVFSGFLHCETNWNSCSSLDHRYRAKWRQSKNLFKWWTRCRDNSMLWIKRSRGWQQKICSSDKLAHQGWRRLRLRLDKQFRQWFFNANPRSNERQSLSTSKALVNFQRSKQNLQH